MGNIVIHKFPVPHEGPTKMPHDATILSTGFDRLGNLCVWAMVDESHPADEDRNIEVYGTGQLLPTTCVMFIGTTFHGPFVWHVFERP